MSKTDSTAPSGLPDYDPAASGGPAYHSIVPAPAPRGLPGLLPADQVTTLLRLLDALLGDDQITARAATYTRTYARDPYQARQAAEAFQAGRVSSLLAGVLSNKAGGVTQLALEWGIDRARTQLEPSADSAEGGERPCA